ncbi:MAG: CotH kinase family protein [Flavobacteriales bacterium]
MRIIIFSVAILLSHHFHSQVVINEVMSQNSNIFENELDASPDWIELYNTCACPVNLSGWSITDDYDAEFPNQSNDLWLIPDTTLLPFQHLIILATGNDPLMTDYLQADFKLKQSGEELFLLKENLNVEDQLSFTCIPSNRSFGRYSSDSLTYFFVPSPAAANIISTTFNQLSDSISISHPSGFYDSEISVDASSQSPLFFTTDGSEPSINSPLWNAPLLISETYKSDGSAFIRTSNLWEEPRTDVYSGTVINLSTFDNGCPSSEPVTASYFVHPDAESKFPYGVISIITDPINLFSDSGIYVPGTSGENYFKQGDDWEKRGHLEYYKSANNAPVISQEVDFRTRGRGSRGNRQKSLKFFARDDYGKTWFDYPIFPKLDIERYRRLVLRSGHSDFTKSMIKDLVATELVRGLDLEYMESEPVTVFINGEYWGIQFLRENLSEYYLAEHYGINPNAVDIIKNNQEVTDGSITDYLHLLNFATQNDLGTLENYEAISEKMDISNFIDYNISQLYLANWDWPFNNVKAWKPQQESAKFRWMFFDCDACLYKKEYDELVTTIENDDRSADYVLMSQLIKNESFKNRFYTRYLELMNANFSSETILSSIDSLKTLLKPAMVDHINRWSSPSSFSAWEESISEMRNFALQRPIYSLQQLETIFSSPFSVRPNPAEEIIYLGTELPEGNISVSVFDYAGIRMPIKVNESGSLDISELSGGFYVIRIVYENLIFTEKFLKL